MIFVCFERLSKVGRPVGKVGTMKLSTKLYVSLGGFALVAAAAVAPVSAYAAAPGATSVSDTSANQIQRLGDPVAASKAFATSTQLVNAAQQESDALAVAAFAEAHSEPVLPKGASAVEYAAYEKAIANYWTAVPWSAVAGQWGCTVESVQVDTSQAAPVVSETTNCGSNLDAATLLNSSGVVTRSVALRSASAASDAAVKALSVTPQAAQLSYCGPTNSVTNCVTGNGSGVIGASATWYSSQQTTGHVRLGQVTPNTCGLGSLKSNSADKLLGYGSTTSVNTTTNVNSGWSARFYNPNFYGGYCHTL
jgi:hypothetical protein